MISHHDQAAADQANREHMTAARRSADVLVARTRQLLRNGADLTDPDRWADYVRDQVRDAISDAQVPHCERNTAADTLAAELARMLAEATR
jgi:hypothetical protein